jgi:hypothetical protein
VKLPFGSALVIVLHGSGMDGKKMRKWTGYEFDRLADRQGFALVYPDGYRGKAPQPTPYVHGDSPSTGRRTSSCRPIDVPRHPLPGPSSRDAQRRQGRDSDTVAEDLETSVTPSPRDGDG